MPLQDSFPVIDDRTYANIVAEARSRIPRYTPEWTDLNETDPGMIMVELFAWLTEMQLFRMNQIPALNYFKFLELVGIELEPATAATAQLTFPVKATHPESTVIVPSKTQVTTDNPDEKGPIIFEVDRAFTAVRAQLQSLQADDGFNYRDISTDNDDTSIGFQPFGPNAAADNAFMLGFSEELPEAQISLWVWAPVSSGSRVVSQCFTQTPIYVSSQIQWEYWDGHDWQSLTLLKDESGAFTRSGEILLKGPQSGNMVASSIGSVSDARFWIRARITSASYETAPSIIAIRTNTTRATQAETIEFETVGGSNGEVDQTLALQDSPVLPGTLVLQVDEGTGYETWTEVSDFFGSGGDDPHYVLNRATGEIRFGDSVNGRVPVANPRMPANIRALSYRVGGGQRGNVAADSLVSLRNSVSGIDAAKVSNLFAAAGGADEESLESAIKRAPNSLKSHDRAVTRDDFAELAQRAANIARAETLPLYHPSFPNTQVPGVVSVVVIPDIDDPAPEPSAGTLQTVCAYLNERRLLTTELFVIGPTYQTITITAELVAEATADLAEVKSSAIDNLELYFHPLYGGEDSDPSKAVDDPERLGSGWPFGGDVFYSLLYRRLLFSGVKRIVSLSIEIDGDEFPPCQDVAIAAGILLTSGEHNISVNYEVGS